MSTVQPSTKVKSYIQSVNEMHAKNQGVYSWHIIECKFLNVHFCNSQYCSSCYKIIPIYSAIISNTTFTTFMAILLCNWILCYPSSLHNIYITLSCGTNVRYFNLWSIHWTLLQLDVIAIIFYLLHSTAVFSPTLLLYIIFPCNTQ